jgi:hypothetical protein
MICTPRIEAATVKLGVAVPPRRRERPPFTHSRRRGARDLALTAVSVLDTCVSNCAGSEHNGVVIVTSRGTLRRCLSCRNERMLVEPPRWCHAMSLDVERRAATRRPAPAGMSKRGGRWI